MNTIEQASLEYAEHEANDFPSGDCRADMNLCEIEDWFKDAFKAGVEFAQHWISVEEELPKIGEKVITKMTKDKERLMVQQQEYVKNGRSMRIGLTTHFQT